MQRRGTWKCTSREVGILSCKNVCRKTEPVHAITAHLEPCTASPFSSNNSSSFSALCSAWRSSAPPRERPRRMMFGNVECFVSLVRITLRRSPSAKHEARGYCTSGSEQDGDHAHHGGQLPPPLEEGPERSSAGGFWRVLSMDNTTLGVPTDG